MNIKNEKHSCAICAYYDDFSWVCFNPEATDGGDFVIPEHVCVCWKSRRINHDNKKRFEEQDP